MFGDSFWEFLRTLLENYGLLALVEVVQIFVIVHLFRLLNSKELEKFKLTEKLLELSERRLEDAKEEREDYEELARNLDKSINLLVKVFQHRNGD